MMVRIAFASLIATFVSAALNVSWLAIVASTLVLFVAICESGSDES